MMSLFDSLGYSERASGYRVPASFQEFGDLQRCLGVVCWVSPSAVSRYLQARGWFLRGAEGGEFLLCKNPDRTGDCIFLPRVSARQKDPVNYARRMHQIVVRVLEVTGEKFSDVLLSLLRDSNLTCDSCGNRDRHTGQCLMCEGFLAPENAHLAKTFRFDDDAACTDWCPRFDDQE